MPATGPPLGMLAELTHRCPLQCPYCSNPVDYSKYPDHFQRASPQHFKDNIISPIVTFHGKLDPNASIEGFEAMVSDFNALGISHEETIYDTEAHVFAQRKTWLDAFTKMENALEKYLK